MVECLRLIPSVNAYRLQGTDRVARVTGPNTVPTVTMTKPTLDTHTPQLFRGFRGAQGGIPDQRTQLVLYRSQYKLYIIHIRVVSRGHNIVMIASWSEMK